MKRNVGKTRYCKCEVNISILMCFSHTVAHDDVTVIWEDRPDSTDIHVGTALCFLVVLMYFHLV